MKCQDLKRRIRDVENENDILAINIYRAKRSITRLRLERALLQEKLEEKTPAHVDDSEGSESELSSVLSHIIKLVLMLIRRLNTENLVVLKQRDHDDGVVPLEHHTLLSQ